METRRASRLSLQKICGKEFVARFILGKIGQYAVVLWIAVTLNFALPRLMPGNPLALLAGEEVGMLTAQQRTQLMANVGLDQPLPAQYVRFSSNRSLRSGSGCCSLPYLPCNFQSFRRLAL